MEFVFLALLIVLLAVALGSGYPVALAIPGSAILTIVLAALCGQLFAGDTDAYFVHGGGPDAWLSAGVINIRRIYRSDESDVLIAIPLFIFMGLMLERSKVAEELLLAMSQLFRSIRGGLGVSVIFVGALLAATTSVIGATVIAMGTISLPTMLRNNYSNPLAAGVVAATGTLGQIIPPSIVLIILNQQLTTAVYQASNARRELYKLANGSGSMPSGLDVASVSVGEMFMGALVPGLLLVALYMMFMLGTAALRSHMVPASQDAGTHGYRLVARVALALVPPLVLIFLVLGSIITGVATVNQAGAVGAAGATVMAGYRLYEGRRGAFMPAIIAVVAVGAIGLIVTLFNVNLRNISTSQDLLGVILAALASAAFVFAVCWSGWRTLKTMDTLKHVVDQTTKTTSLVFAILLGAVMLTAAFRAFGGEDLVRDFLQNIPGGFWGQFCFVMLVIFALGFFLDFIEITIVVVPIIAPIILAEPSANVTALWFGVMLAIVIQTSFLTPPFGFALFYLRGVAPPSIRTIDIYKGVIPFIVMLLLSLGLVGIFPQLVNYLPQRAILLSDAAPPTTNPRLQHCMEDYVSQRFEQKGQEIRAAIASARLLDIRMVPEELRDQLAQSFDKADQAFAAMRAIAEAQKQIAKAATAYRPVLAEVRQHEREIRRLDQEVAKLQTTISRAGRSATEDEAESARTRLAELIPRREALAAQIPAGWDAMHDQFSAMVTEETNARRAYRRTVDDAYEPLRNLLQAVGEVELLKALEGSLRELDAIIRSEAPATVGERMKQTQTAFAALSGTGLIRQDLRKARRSLKGASPDAVAARDAIAQAVAHFVAEVRWRERVRREALPQLNAYDAAIADTIALRGLRRLPNRVAKHVAACSAEPRDIFVHF